MTNVLETSASKKFAEGIILTNHREDANSINMNMCEKERLGPLELKDDRIEPIKNCTNSMKTGYCVANGKHSEKSAKFADASKNEVNSVYLGIPSTKEIVQASIAFNYERARFLGLTYGNDTSVSARIDRADNVVRSLMEEDDEEERKRKEAALLEEIKMLRQEALIAAHHDSSMLEPPTQVKPMNIVNQLSIPSDVVLQGDLPVEEDKPSSSIKRPRTQPPHHGKLLCSYCGSNFSIESTLKRHIEVVHFGRKEFQCSYCEKTFGYSSHCKRHERIHTDERPYGCRFCSRRFTDNSGLNSHMRSHTEVTHMKGRPRCLGCGKCFYDGSTLARHMRQVNCAVPRINNGEVVCSICMRRFKNMSGLVSHQAMHMRDLQAQAAEATYRVFGTSPSSERFKTRSVLAMADDMLLQPKCEDDSIEVANDAPIPGTLTAITVKAEPDDDDNEENVICRRLVIAEPLDSDSDDGERKPSSDELADVDGNSSPDDEKLLSHIPVKSAGSTEVSKRKGMPPPLKIPRRHHFENEIAYRDFLTSLHAEDIKITNEKFGFRSVRKTKITGHMVPANVDAKEEAECQATKELKSDDEGLPTSAGGQPAQLGGDEKLAINDRLSGTVLLGPADITREFVMVTRSKNSNLQKHQEVCPAPPIDHAKVDGHDVLSARSGSKIENSHPVSNEIAEC